MSRWPDFIVSSLLAMAAGYVTGKLRMGSGAKDLIAGIAGLVIAIVVIVIHAALFIATSSHEKGISAVGVDMSARMTSAPLALLILAVICVVAHMLLGSSPILALIKERWHPVVLAILSAVLVTWRLRRSTWYVP